MQPTEWEACLTRHYLRSDGPSGDGPITFIDATPAELRAAAGRDEWSDEATRLSFLRSINASEARAWLDGRIMPAGPDSAIPGYFRYLVLTCFVVATDDDATDTHDFRMRLAHVLGKVTAFQSVSGVNRLWQTLAKWCERRRSIGAPIRRLVLPDPGNMVLIGHAVRLAFPAWRDRTAFARLLGEIPPALRRDPLRLTEELMRPHRWFAVPARIQEVCQDFAMRLERQNRMLQDHRFWSLVTSIDASLVDPTTRTKKWVLEVTLGGYEGDEAHLRLYVDDRARHHRLTDERQWLDIALEDLLSGRMQIPVGLASAVEAGTIPLAEQDGGRWAFEGHFPASDEGVVLLAGPELCAQLGDVGHPWVSIGLGWRVSARLSKTEANIARATLRGFVKEDVSPLLVEFRVVGGVRTGGSTYLGRPKFLPCLYASQAATIRVDPSEYVDGVLGVVGAAPRWTLSAQRPLTGRWALIATEGGLDHEKTITLEADAPERTFAPTDQSDTRFESEVEIQVQNTRLTPSHRTVSRATSSGPATELDDVLEAVYTAPPQGWSEAELIPLLQTILPDRRIVWDVLRSLAEAGWIDPYVSRSWRARRWRLRPPGLIKISNNCVLVDGAIGARSRRRLISAVSVCNGEIEVRSGISKFAPASLVVHGVRVADLAAECGWPCTGAMFPDLRPAPGCWIADRRTTDGRSLAGTWCFDLGHFQSTAASIAGANGVAIERWRRERGDDRDIYRVSGAGPDLILSARNPAILEGYRRARRELYRWSDGWLLRAANGGYLPLAVARALRYKSLVAAGPVLPHGEAWSYGYAADVASAQWLAALFGPAVGVPSSQRSSPWMQPRIRARRAGIRPTAVELFALDITNPAERRRS